MIFYAGHAPYISIHALLAESDWNTTQLEYNPIEFLSTLSLRRATGCHGAARSILIISIHALLAESDVPYCAAMSIMSAFLSTLSLRRATQLAQSLLPTRRDFYPRSPCGERLFIRADAEHREGISIHALLAESDTAATAKIACYCISIHALLAESDNMHIISSAYILNFYPRSPCGERLKHSGKLQILNRFLSTLSLRRATVRK